MERRIAQNERDIEAMRQDIARIKDAIAQSGMNVAILGNR